MIDEKYLTGYLFVKVFSTPMFKDTFNPCLAG